MKRGNLAFKVLTALFFVAVLAYIGVYVYNSIENPFSTTTAVLHTIYDGADVEGILVRDEISVSTEYETVYVVAEEAKRLPNNGVIAYTYSSQNDFDKAVEIRNIMAQIDYLKGFGKELDTNNQLQLKNRLKNGIVEMKKLIQGRRLASLETMSLNLRTLAFFDGSNAEEIERSLSELNYRLYELGSEHSIGAEKITAPSAGLFSVNADGFESIKPEALQEFTPGRLSALLEEHRMLPDNVIGKIVHGTKWYYAAIVKAEEAKKLTVGGTVRLIFGKYYSEQLNMTVESISTVEDGACVVVFSCDYALADTISMRKQSAEMLKAVYSGIKVPKKAVRLDENGNECVYIVTGPRMEKKTINIIYEFEGFYLVAVENDRTDALRTGDTIIVKAKNLYDGKVIGS